MSTQTNINIRTDSNIKEKAEILFEDLGMNMSTAINIFLIQAIRYGGIPFDIKKDYPNDETISAINEGKLLLKDKSVKGYNSIKDLKKALDV